MKKIKVNKKVIIIISIVVLVGTVVGISMFFGLTKNRYKGIVRDSQTNAPLANVSVTNGRDVVKTDSEGKFVLDKWSKTEFIIVSIPTGYWTEDYYIAVSNDIESYDFSLVKQVGNDANHNFLHMTDSEVRENGVGTWIEGVKDTVAETSPAFIVHTGDICGIDGLKTHKSGMNTENMGVPVRYVIGNHDYVEYGSYGEALFEEIYGPVWYSFDVGDIHYVVTPIGHGDARARYSKSDTWRWLANDLKNVDAGKKVVIFNHDYCPDENGFVVKYGTKKLDLRKKGLLAWVFGHWHYNYMNEINGIFNITTSRPDAGGIDQSPSAVRSVYFEGNKLVSSEMHYYDFDFAKPEIDTNWLATLSGRGLFGEPIVVGNKIYVGTIDDGYPKKSKIYCVDADSGEIIFERPTINSIRNTMAYDNGKIYAQDVEGRVYCLDGASGAELWRTDCELEEPRNTGAGVVVDGDNVYCGGQQKICCIDKNTGKIKWSTKNTGANASATRMRISGNTLVYGAHWDELLAFDKNTEKKIWSNKKDGLSFITSTPYLYDGKVIISSGSILFELSLDKGVQQRRKEFEDYTFDTASQPLVIGDIGYFATANRGIVAIKISTFEKIWDFETEKSLIYTSPYSSGDIKSVDGSIITKNGYLYFGASDGNIYKVDASTGTLIDSKKIGSPIFSSLAIYGDNVIVMDYSGNLINIDFE